MFQLGVVEEVEDHLFSQDYVVADHADVQIGNMLPQLISRKERLCVVLILFSVFLQNTKELLNCVVDSRLEMSQKITRPKVWAKNFTQ